MTKTMTVAIAARIVRRRDVISGGLQAGEGAGTCAEASRLEAEALQHAEVEIAERNARGGGLWEGLVLAMAEPATSENDGQIVVGVRVGIPHATAEKRHGVIEKRAVAVLHHLHLAEEAGKLLGLVFL